MWHRSHEAITWLDPIKVWPHGVGWCDNVMVEKPKILLQEQEACFYASPSTETNHSVDSKYSGGGNIEKNRAGWKGNSHHGVELREKVMRSAEEQGLFLVLMGTGHL